ncbi:DUF6124 family protein [Pseudomonas sp. W22_MBD1_FP4]|uniref:DUF6124 family protein n=1 Tax=Pseudomonas sp. W22_MBD1_FP4 TaxID=3240272 RepID=UPI003F97D991
MNGPDLKLNHAAHRTIDHYLNAGAEPLETPLPHATTLFSVADDVRSEVLIADSYETFSSVTALLLGLSDELTGKQRDVALAIHPLSELWVLLVGKLMERE